MKWNTGLGTFKFPMCCSVCASFFLCAFLFQCMGLFGGVYRCVHLLCEVSVAVMCVYVYVCVYMCALPSRNSSPRSKYFLGLHSGKSLVFPTSRRNLVNV